MKDPIVEEIRRYRRQIEEECGGDADAYYKHLLKVQEKYKDRLVSLKPVPLPTADRTQETG